MSAGPMWSVCVGSGAYEVRAQNGQRIARCLTRDSNYADACFNARLIAASRELLAALQACYDLIAEEVADGECTEQAKIARSAIFKATGELP